MSKNSSQPYRRVDLEKVEVSGSTFEVSGSKPDTRNPKPETRLRWSIIPLSALLCVVQAIVAVVAENVQGVILTPTLISVLAFGVLFLFVLAVNPLLRLMFFDKVLRPLNRLELVCVFSALLVTSGVSTFGLSSQLVPIIATPWNPQWNNEQKGWSRAVIPHLNPKLYLSVPEEGPALERERAIRNILVFREGLQPVDHRGEVVAQPAEQAPLTVKAQYWWLVCKQTPWDAWIGPVTYWLIFIFACYGLFYCLTYVVLGYWSGREKLIFPLVRLGESLLPAADASSRIPAIIRQPGFWALFALSFFILSWNGAVGAQWITGSNRILLGMSYSSVDAIIKGTILEGLSGGQFRLMFLIIFTAIGLSFLLPVEISFSLWFYFIIGKLMILFAVWMGYGQTGADFPSDWIKANNFVTAQGAGGMLLFSAVSLWRCVADFIRLGRGKGLWERLTLALPVVGLVICLAIITLWLNWNNLPLWWGLAVTLFLTLITLGLMRLVAEGGVYWFQCHTSVFHIFKYFALGKYVSTAFLVPLLPIYWVLFTDIKAFLAPNLLNMAKLHDEVTPHQQGGRGKFHFNLVLCLVISVVIAVGFTIFLAHVRGGQQMNSWFYNSGPTGQIDDARALATAPVEFDAGIASSYGVGGAWVALSMFARRTLFWFPHPIGYIMLINPLISQLWFSIFLGWVCKKIVVKYGGKSTFDKIKPMFIGLIMGELMAILIWSILGMAMNFSSGLSLNRYGA